MKTIIERSRGTVRFAFKESIKILKQNKKRKSLIYLHFNYGEKRFKYSTGFKSCFDDWDFRKQRVKNKSEILNKDEINGRLGDLEKFLMKLYASLSNDPVNFSNDLLKHQLDVFTKKVNPIDIYIEKLSLTQIIEKYINEGQRSKVTNKAYKQTLNNLKVLEKEQNRKLLVDEIDISFYYDFLKFLEKKYRISVVGKHIKNFKTFMNFAIAKGYEVNRNYNSKDFKEIKEESSQIFLSEEEIQKMFEVDLSSTPHLELARDIFIIGCETGQRISDYNNLKNEDIIKIDGVDYFKIIQKKNRKYSRKVLCPITKRIREIMVKRHHGNPPKKISEQKLNRYIKRIGEQIGIDEIIKCEYTKCGNHIIELKPKHQLIMSHTARRSFCTNKYLAGMNVYDIMLFSGHTTEKEFYKYIRVKEVQRASHIVKSGFFNV